MNRHLFAASLAVIFSALTLSVLPAEARTVPDAAARAAVAGDDSYTATKTVSRTFTDALGVASPASSYDVTVKANHTKNLRGRQRVLITWNGAQPSGGRASNPYGENGLSQEYPVVILQCRGVDDPTLPVAKQLQPETCWTNSVAQRSQVLRSTSEATWVHDAYADPADKERVSGLDPIPADTCPAADINPYFTRLTPFVSRAGKVYPACTSAAMPPEAAVDAAFPAAEVAAFTDENGNGSAQFELRSDVENESLGCSNKVACSIVVIPIAGLSCDQESVPPTAGDMACRKLGRFAPGSSNFANEGIDQAVGPTLWWSASNWRNRFSIPITFGLPPDTCDVLDSRPPTGFYGSELLAQAALQWSPAYCLNKNRFKFQHNQISDTLGFQLMESGEGPAAVVSSAHQKTSEDPVGYAPTAVTGFAVGYVIDRPKNAGELGTLRLNARLIAKLLSQSYLGSDLGRGHPGIGDNPLSIVQDPEFTKLNPNLTDISQEAAATLLSVSISSDVIEQLTEYIKQDPDAVAFLKGKPDPSGMVVNPSYKNIRLPRDEWPLLDNYIPKTENTCRQKNPTVYFTAVAAPVSSMRKISEALLDAWPNVQTRCDLDVASGQYKLGRIERQSFGSRFMLGIVSLGDAERYGLRTALLQTKKDKYVGATTASISRAITLSEQKTKRGPFVLDQADVRKDGAAYPGTMVIYTAARLRNLDQDDADHVAQFIRVSTTEGQKVGSGNGQLPAGFVPIRKTGPTAKLFAAAADVADAVEAQTPAPTTPPTADPTPEPTAAPTIDPVDPATDDTDLTPPGSGDPSTAPAPAVTPTTYPVLEDAAPTAATPATEDSMAGKLFPILLGLGLLGLLYSLGSRFLVRPPRRKT